MKPIQKAVLILTITTSIIPILLDATQRISFNLIVTAQVIWLGLFVANMMINKRNKFIRYI
jgi:hypothetical protein